MYVELGNAHAVNLKRVDYDDGSYHTKKEPVEGNQVTRLDFPEGLPLLEAFNTVVAVCRLHFNDDDSVHGHHLPAWIESDSEGLKNLLAEHYGVTKARPKSGWPVHPHAEAAKE